MSHKMNPAVALLAMLPVTATNRRHEPVNLNIGLWRHAAKLFAIAALLSCPLLLGTPAFAQQWSTNPNGNNPISTEARNQSYPAITSDGEGGAIMAWTDERRGLTSDIYAQRIDAAGKVLWTTGGVLIAATAGYPCISSDGLGGAYITWADGRIGFNNSQIYAQRINALGDVLWKPNGVAVATAPNQKQGHPTITTDGTGGAVIAWTDFSGQFNGIYAQRINAAGELQWLPTATGVHVSSVGHTPDIVSDGAEGAIITWAVPSGVRAQRVNGAGKVQWIPTGTGVTVMTGFPSNDDVPVITSDGSAGAIITWHDDRFGLSDKIFAQRINALGVVQWAANGVAITNTPGFEQTHPTIVSDEAGGAIITWNDNRGDGPDSGIYAQRIDAAGKRLWTDDGAAISTAAVEQGLTSIVSDGAGGAIITWDDGREINAGGDIYAQRISAAGKVQWPINGVPVSTAGHMQLLNERHNLQSYRANIVGNSAGCAIIAWTDGRSRTYFDVYAQQVNGSGHLGSCTCPTITIEPSKLGNQPSLVKVPYPPVNLMATGGAAPYAFAVSDGILPPGMVVDPDGTLHGTPVTQGAYDFTVKVTDANGCTRVRAYQLTINCPPITLDPVPGALPAPAINTPYSQPFTATGGCSSSCNYSVTSGALPNGLTLGADGVLSGMATQAGTYDFTVTATDSCGCSQSQTYTLTANVRQGDFPFTRGMNEFCIWGGGGPFNSPRQIDNPNTGLTNNFFTPGNTSGERFGAFGLCYGRILSANDRFAFKYTFNAIPVAVLSYPDVNPDLGVPVPGSETRRNVFGAGLSPIGFQLYFRPQSRIKPFINTSGGFIFFKDPVPGLNGSSFNFTYDFGGGVQVFRDSQRAFNFGYKYQRISNGGRALNNPGFDGHVFYFGYSIFKAPQNRAGQ